MTIESIRKIKIVKKPKSDLEKLLDYLNPNWKKGELFNWDYLFDSSQQLTPEKVYDLKDFIKEVSEVATFSIRPDLTFILYQEDMKKALGEINNPTDLKKNH